MPEKEITVVSENRNCSGVPVSVTLEPNADFAHVKMVDVASGDSEPCQWEKSDGKVSLSWIVYDLGMGQAKKYKAIFGDEKGSETAGVLLKEAGEGQIDVNINRSFFTSYYFGDVIRPHFHPVIGPTGKSVTRGYPMIEGVPGENSDHHHQSNLETWIPYQLAEYATVAIRIYNAQGQPVRKLEVGNKTAGAYFARETAAYWDGKNDCGGPVASGIYLYQFMAGNFSMIRRMLVVK